jgi:hypothetical protein
MDPILQRATKGGLPLVAAGLPFIERRPKN